MRQSLWLAGAFSAYGLAGAIKTGKRHKISLMTASPNTQYVKAFHDRAGIGRIESYHGRWHWICDDPAEVKTFHLAVSATLIPDKLEMIETAWETWRQRMLDATDGEVDPGPIDGDPPDAA